MGVSLTQFQLLLDLQEPWVNDAVVIGGASAVLSPIIQWGHTILQSKPQVHHAVLMKSLLPTITEVTRTTIVESLFASNAVLLLMRMGLKAIHT